MKDLGHLRYRSIIFGVRNYLIFHEKREKVKYCQSLYWISQITHLREDLF